MAFQINSLEYEEQNVDNNYYADIEKRVSLGKSITQNEAENYLRRLCYEVRKSINPNMNNYDYKCDLAQSIFGHYFNKIGCKYSPCATHINITSGVDGHSFTVVSLNVEGEEKPFLLDPTYIQFFHQEKCQKSAFFVSPILPNRCLLTPDAGYFIKEEDRDATNFLLRYGYIELTPEYARMYGDSFLNTKAGADPNNLKFQTMPGKVYINSFLTGKEKLSKSEAELMYYGQTIVPFQERVYRSSKAI